MNTVCPVVIEAAEYEDEFAVGGNGLILLRCYDGDTGVGWTTHADAKRPEQFAVFSVQEAQWKVFDTPCASDGTAVVGLAMEEPLAAMMYSDGMLRFYDWEIYGISH